MTKLELGPIKTRGSHTSKVKYLLLIIPLLGLFTSAGQAAPIFISSGQCIIIGSQQVCALKSEGPSAEGKRIINVCRYGDFQDSEIPSLKSYALVEIVLMDSGRKHETITKNYGPNGKEACEQELLKLSPDRK